MATSRFDTRFRLVEFHERCGCLLVESDERLMQLGETTVAVLRHRDPHVGAVVDPVGQDLVEVILRDLVANTIQRRWQPAFVPHLGNRRGKQEVPRGLRSAESVADMAGEAVERRHCLSGDHLRSGF